LRNIANLDLMALPFSNPVATARCLIAALTLLAATGTALSDSMTGQASVIDGDTLEIHGARIRLCGIDAPEADQLCRTKGSEPYRCGQTVANDLDAFTSRRPVECVEVDRDQYKRAVAVCTVAGVDLAEWLVKNGLALDWPQYSKGAYAAALDEAKRADRGMWSGSSIEPWRYRACRRPGGLPERCSD
jgi:endonuclease YncB( thermonuclease family)